MSYIIKRIDQGGGYLRNPPLNGWTYDLRKVRLFDTREQAERECCPENEIAIPLDSVAGRER